MTVKLKEGESPIPAQRIVVVTGGSAGIGQACVIKLVESGHQVIALGRREPRLRELVARCGSDKVHALICDVRDRQSLRQALAGLPSLFSKLDTLINNAGLMLGHGVFEDLHDEDIDTMVATNCIGVLNATSALLSSLSESGRGHILNITSIASSYPYVGGHVYAGTKAFVEHFGACLRTELVDRHIKVTNLSPGRTETEFNIVRSHGISNEVEKGTAKTQSLTADDVARAVCWAISQPAHVNINSIEIVPSRQSLSFR